MKNDQPLLLLARKYFETDPVSAAHNLEAMSSHDAVDVLKSLPVTMAAGALKHINDAYVAVLLERMPRGVFVKLVSALEEKQAANIFLQFSQELRKEFLALLDEPKRKKVQEFLTFPVNSAGRIMSVDFIAFHAGLKVKEAVQKIRHLAQKGSKASYIYVIDEQNRLSGVLRMRDLLLSEDHVLLEQIMQKEVYQVNCFTDRELVANDLKQRNYFAAPVVDNEHRMLGVVRAEHLIGDVQEEATEDIQKMFGASGDENVFSPMSFSLRTRLPWLHVNLLTAFLAAAVVSLFEDVIAKITVLAVYLPVVAGQGGNAGAQSLAVVMRGIIMREIPPHKAKQLILKETGIGFINGLVIGLVTGVVAWLWQGMPFLGVVIALGMLVNLTVAGLAGAMIPLAMKGLGLDPAQCSNIILTTITDVMGFFAFLGFAVVFQNYLM